MSRSFKQKFGRGGSISMTSFLDDIERDLRRGERRQRAKAARHVRKAMLNNLDTEDTSAPGDYPGLNTGNLRDSIKVKNYEDASLVGPVAPAYHAHILEFGRKAGKSKNKKTGAEVTVHNMEPRPFMEPTFIEERKEVQKILSDPWI